MADLTLVAAVNATKVAAGSLIQAAGGALQPEDIRDLMQKIAVLEATATEVGTRKDHPPSRVAAYPLPTNVQVVRDITARPADGLPSAEFQTEWPGNAAVVGLRLGVRGIAALTQDLLIQAFANLSVRIRTKSGTGPDLFSDGRIGTFAQFLTLVSPFGQLVWPLSQYVTTSEAWMIQFINETTGIAGVIPVVEFEYIDLTKMSY
jgi:hypothetical protein